MKVVISRVCDDTRPAIRSAVFGLQMQYDTDALILPGADAKKVLQLLEKALVGSYYVVAENTQDTEEIAILKSGDIEQLGLYLCGYCAMVFSSEVERNAHQRIHYFGFG